LSKKIFKNANVFVSDGDFVNASIYVNEGKIEAITNSYIPDNGAEVIDCTDKLIVPGFIDIHIHGRCGFDTMKILNNPDEIHNLAKSMSGTGVTSFLPTTLTCGFDEYLRVLSLIAEYIERQPKDCPQALGIYSESNYFNPLRTGAQNPDLLRAVTMDEIEKAVEAGKGKIRIFALAPELGNAIDAVRLLSRQGIVVTMAHTDASYEEAKAAFVAGMKSVTHIFNGMRPMSHLEPGATGTGLYLNGLYCEAITDGMHILPEVVNLLYRMKPLDKIVMITDNVWIAGLEDGNYSLGGVPVVKEGNKLIVKSEERYSLAGSCLTLDVALKNVIAFTKRSVEEILPCLTSNPAALIGMNNRKGSIKVGMDADLNVLSPGLDVLETYVEGELIFKNKK
jgi:N-acetylglucosamine-6-phosphate deacetylase